MPEAGTVGQPTELSQLYPAGTPMSEVAPDFRGMSLAGWRHQKLLQQFKSYQDSIPADAPKPLAEKAVSTPRDNYGLKGI